jgi:hypothetical protein
MQTLIDKLKKLNVRVDLATTAPQSLEDDRFLVFSKLEGLITDAEGKLVPKIKIQMGGVSENAEEATALSIARLEQVLDTEVLNLVLAKGFGYDVAASQPLYQRSENYLVVGKVEIFDFDTQGKPRTISKVSINVFDQDPIKAQEIAISSVIDTTKKLQ